MKISLQGFKGRFGQAEEICELKEKTKKIIKAKKRTKKRRKMNRA